eukprot:scaffold48918_cov72-Phaeocystis_antarctica.AAC.2
MEGILPRSAPKIEHDPNMEAATAHVAIDPVTGVSSDELSAFAVMFFRTAYPFDTSTLSAPPGGIKGGGEPDGAGPPTSLGAVSRADNAADVAVVQPRVVPHKAQEAVNSRPREGSGGGLQRPKPYQAPTHRRAHQQMGCFPSCGQPPGSLDDQGRGTPRQQALHVARQRMQISRTDAEIHQIARTLSLALGSARTESATIKAVHAVLLHLDRPGMSKKEAYTSTGASMSTFKKWQRRVQYAQLDLPPPAEQKTAAVNRSVQIGG